MENINNKLTVDSTIDASDFEVLGQDLASLNEMSRPSTNFWKDAFGRLLRDKSAIFFMVLLGIILVFAIFAPMFSPYTFDKVHPMYTNQPMFTSVDGHFFLFGTDSLGRDLLVRSADGVRVSLFIAISAVAINCVIGVVYGGIAGYFGGRLDNVMMRICEIINGIPYLLIIILLMTVIEKGISTIIIAYSIVGWVGMARLVRGEVIRLKGQEFVISAQTMGASATRIIFKHLVPNILSIIVVSLTMAIPSVIFTEAFLSFISLGIPVPGSSLGTLANSGISVFQQYPSQLWIPAVLISSIMLSFNMLGDKLRDAFDPKLRR